MSKQAAILVALSLLVVAASMVSVGAWILLRRGRRPSQGGRPGDLSPEERTAERPRP
jgi:hypothetical protein